MVVEDSNHFKCLDTMRIFIVFIIVFSVATISAQVWMDEGKNNDGSLNFYTVQSAAESYFDTIRTEKGKGFKPYKRWEEYWRHRILEDGSFPEAGFVDEEYERYLRRQPQGSRSTTSNWESLGPVTSQGGYFGIGRINCVAFHPSDANQLWVGSPGGGLWKSIDGGDNWFTTFDQNTVLGVSSIVIQSDNPNILYIATGDGDGFDTFSTGVLKSTDGGNTWQTTGLNWNVSQNRVIRRLIISPDDANILLAATSNGLYRTVNGGNSWSQILTGNFYDVKANPDAGSQIFYAATGSGIWRSVDSGSSFQSVQTVSGSGRIALGVSSDNTNYVYALCSNASNNGFLGLYRSTSSGASSSFVLRANSPNLLGWQSNGSDTGGQGWYDLSLAIDPLNANIVYVGGVNTWKSTNGGTSWTLRSHWSGANGVQTVHADKHCFEWQNNTTLWEGNDGGIYKSTNGGVNWTDKSDGLVISQMYRMEVSEQDMQLIAGLQDNGTKIRDNDGDFTVRIGGDGMDCAIRHDNQSVLYGSVYFGTFFRSTNGGDSFNEITNTISDEGAWVTPFAIDPTNTQTIYMGTYRVWRSTNQGTNWTAISPTLTGNTNNKLDYLHISPSNNSVIYAGRNNALYRTTNGGANWSTMTVPGNNVRELAIHPNDPNTIWAIRSNYSNGNKVYQSTNGGASWTNISSNLPNLPVNCIIYQIGSNNGLYIGMDVGVYYKNDTLSSWVLFSNNLPNVEVTDLKIKYSSQEIYAATYGRGVWKSHLYEPTSCTSVMDISVLDVGTNHMQVSWQIPNAGSPSSYEILLSTQRINPTGQGISTTSTTLSVNNLTSNTAYYVFVRSQCNGEFSSWAMIGPIRTLQTCGDFSFDTGGNAQNYYDNEDIIWTICPSMPYQVVQISFTDFDVEADWDALYIHNGNSINGPLFPSNNPASQAGFPAGGYWGTVLPGTFISTHSSGCLTLRFRSDEAVTEAGWVANINCIANCPTVVSSPADSGLGSLRDIIQCSASGVSLTIDPSLHNDTIKVLSPIIIDKNIEINAEGTMVHIQSMHSDQIYTVQSGHTLILREMQLIAGISPTGIRGILNQGSVHLHDVIIYDQLANTAIGKTIENTGQIFIYGQTAIVGQ